MDGSPFRILFVCTGNVCRSPTAEALMRQRASELGAGEHLVVASAGVGTENGWRIDPAIADLLAKRGISDTSQFRSRLLTQDILDGADLVLTGTRDHRLRIGKSWPDAYPRAFTLRECTWLLGGLSPEDRSKLPTGSVSERGQAMVRWLQDERGLAATPENELDISDPIGRRAAVYRRMVDEVATAVDRVADVLLRAP